MKEDAFLLFDWWGLLRTTLFNIIKRLWILLMRFIGQSTSMLAGFLLLTIVSEVVQSRCMYDLDPQTELPFHIDSEPFEIGFLNACKDYI